MRIVRTALLLALLPAAVAAAQAPDRQGTIVFASTRAPNMWASDLFAAGRRGPINLTRSAGISDGDAAISPDGRRIVFSRTEGGGTDLFTMTTSGGRLRRLTSTPSSREHAATYSPNGDAIAFLRGTSDNNEALWLLDSTGRERRLTPEEGFKKTIAWSPDGTQLAFTDRSGLYVIARDGTGFRQVFNREWRSERPPISWVGQGILIPEDRAQGTFGLRAVNPQTGAPHAFRNPCGSTLPTFSSDRKYVACDQRVEERRIPIRTSRGKLVRWVPLFPGHEHTMIERFTLGPGGRLLVYDAMTDERHSDVWLLGSRLRKLEGNPGDEHSPALSPDRRTVVFVRSAYGYGYPGREGRILFVSANGGRARPLVGNRRGENPAWAPDGKRIAYDQKGQIYVATLATKRARRITRGRYPTWSPNGRSIAFVRTLRAGASIRSIRVNGSGERQLAPPRTAVSDLAWSRDGRSIAFTTGDTISVFTVADRKTRELVEEADNRLSSPTWSPDGNEIAYASGWENDIPYPWDAPDAHFLQIWTVDVTTGRRSRLIGDSGFHFSPDWR